MAWLLMDTTDAISWVPSEANSFLVRLKAVACNREGEAVGDITQLGTGAGS